MAERMDRSTEYGPGTNTAMAGPNGCVLAGMAATSPAVPELWRLLDSDAAPETLMAGIAAHTGDFALLSLTPDGVSLVLAGSARADAGGNQMVCPPGVRRISYLLEAAIGPVVLGLGPPGSPSAQNEARLPLAGGVVPASSLAVTFGPAGVTAKPAPPPVPDPVPPKVVVPDPEDTIVPGPLSVDGPDVDNAGEHAEEAAGTDEPAIDEAEDTSGFEHLVGRTVQRSVEDAAIRSVIEDEHRAGSPPAPAGSDQASPTAPLPVDPPARSDPVENLTVSRPPARANSDAGTGMIDSVPLGSDDSTPARVPEAPPDAGQEPDHELTVQRGVHEALLRQISAPGSLAVTGPSVHAVRCPKGHLNPPHLTSCRVCDSAVAEQPPVTVPRPVLGLLRLSSGDDIVLDRSVLIGRNPSMDRLVEGERPHVVKLPSPDQDISRNHLEVRVSGWHVSVADLNSTNGTVVVRPDQPPERLRPNDPAMIEPGTVVTIADEISFTFVAT